LRLDGGGKLSTDEILDESGDGVVVDRLGLIKRELGHVLNVLDGECGPLGFSQVEGLGVIRELQSRNPPNQLEEQG